LFGELGIETLVAGYEFGHRDDYEGRRVIPSIKVDADSRNIEELQVSQSDRLFKPELLSKKENLEGKGFKFHDYEGMMPSMKKNSLVIDDISHWETEKIIEMMKPDIFCAGIKEKYVVQKHGIPLKQLHSYDYGGPYAGFEGAINFYLEMERMLASDIWKMIDAPWKNEPSIMGSMVYE